MRPKSIHHFRTHQYRVFLADPYLKLDLKKEVKWHEDHLNKLKLHKKNPELFHSERTAHRIDKQRERHFNEHVMDSIPFHQKILAEHKRRLTTILNIMPEKTYKKLKNITIKLKTAPDYLVFDKLSKEFFFIIEKPTPEKEKWSKLVQKKKLCEVLFLE
ncbi:hypothetical protein ACFL3V_04290 [Nanoarchaeota archaeon]